MLFLCSCGYDNMELRRVEVSKICPSDSSIVYDTLLCIAGTNPHQKMKEDSTGNLVANYAYKNPYYIKDERVIIIENNMVLMDTLIKISNKVKTYPVANDNISATVYCSFYREQ